MTEPQPDRMTFEGRSIPQFPRVHGLGPLPHTFTLADIDALRQANAIQRAKDTARRAQSGYPRRGAELDYVRIDERRPRVPGDMVLLLLTMIALGAIAVWIILAAR